MCEFSNILNRVKLDNLMSYLIYGLGSKELVIENCERKVKESYDTIYASLEGQYPEANRNDNDLFDIVVDFATVHDDTYFQVGILTGFQLFKGLEQGFKKSDIEPILEKYVNSNFKSKQNKEETLLAEFFETRVSDALEEALKKDKDYQTASEEITKKVDKIDTINLSPNQWKVVDDALSALNTICSDYGKVAYGQGFRDAAKLATELLGAS